jgi:hypothetical protein
MFRNPSVTRGKLREHRRTSREAGKHKMLIALRPIAVEQIVDVITAAALTVLAAIEWRAMALKKVSFLTQVD